MGNTYTVNELQPKLEPTQVVGIIMAHSSYKGKYIEAIIEDVEPFCLNKTSIMGIDDACVGVQSVEESFPKVMNLLFNDPTDKIRTIVTKQYGPWGSVKEQINFDSCPQDHLI